MVEVGDPEKGTAKYSEAHGIHHSDKALHEEKEEILLYLLQNLKKLIQEVGVQYKQQIDAKKIVEEALRHMGNEES